MPLNLLQIYKNNQVDSIIQKKTKASTTVQFLSPDEEDRSFIAQASEPVNKQGKFENNIIRARNGVDFPMVSKNDINLSESDKKGLKKQNHFITYDKCFKNIINNLS